MEVQNRPQALAETASVQQDSAAQRTLKRAVGYGALFGLVLAAIAAAVTVGFDSASIYFRYALHWGAAFAAIGGWAGAMFFSGENHGVAKPR